MTSSQKEPAVIGVLGSGKGSNCQAIIDAIAAGTLHARIACVISDLEDAFILERARQHGIPSFYISAAPFKTKLEGAAEDRYISKLREYGVTLVALAGFMRIIKPRFLAAFPGRILNIHPSLLPAFPGLEAWRQAVTSGAKQSGCTVHLVDSGTDTGPIILQRTVPVLPSDTAETLHARIQIEEHVAYPEAIRMVLSGGV